MKIRYAIPVLSFAIISASLIMIGKKLSPLSPSLFLFLSVSIGALSFLPFVSFQEYKKGSIKTKLLLILSGCFGTFFANIFYYQGMAISKALKVSLINALNPTFICVLSYLILGRKPTRFQISALLLSLIGLLFVITQGNFNNIAMQIGTGEKLLFSSVIFFGLYSIVIAILNQTYSVSFIVFNSMLLGIPFYAYSLIQSNQSISFSIISMQQWFAICYIGIVGMLINYICYSQSIKYIGPEKTAFYVRSISPMFAALFSYIIFGNIVSGWDFLGFMIIAFALYINDKKV